MNLQTSYAEEIIDILQDAQDVGLNHVVFPLVPSVSELKPQHMAFFDTMGRAQEYLNSKAPYYHPRGPGMEPEIHYRPIDQLINELIKNNITKKQEAMNRNNVEDLRDELKKLGFSDKIAEEMTKQMEKGTTEFTLHDRVNGNKGQVDLSLHFKQSGQSENYYFDKFQVDLNTGKGLEDGQKYMVISPNEQKKGENLVKPFQNVSEAITFFKEQKGNSELAVGKDAAHKKELASMEKGKVNFVAKDFERTFRTPALSQTFYVDRGKGFTAEQATNLIQSRSVYRDDLLNLGGKNYQAWVKLDFDSAKDRYNNYQTNQYHVPSYGFDIKAALEKYDIKELSDPKKEEALIKSFENGNRPLITTKKDGEEVKLYIEAAPQYKQVNFFRMDGKPEKREQFQKEPSLNNNVNIGKAKEKEQEQGMGV